MCSPKMSDLSKKLQGLKFMQKPQKPTKKTENESLGTWICKKGVFNFSGPAEDSQISPKKRYKEK